MDSANHNTDTFKGLFSNHLKDKRLRNTAERHAILTSVCQTKGLFTLEMIWQDLEESNFHVSRASVYNTMELLLDANIVIRHQFAGSIVQYELKYITEQYHYIICTRCNSVQKIKNEKLKRIFFDFKIPKFTVEHYSLQFYGICSKCKYKIAQEEKQVNNNSIKDEKS